MSVDVDQNTSAPASPLPAPARRWAVPLGVILLFIIAMLAAAVAGHPTFTPTGSGPRPLPISSEHQTLPPMASGQPKPQQGDDTILLILSILLLLFVLAVVITAIVLIIRAILLYWHERPLRRRDAENADVDGQAGVVAEPAPDEPTVRRGIEAARAAIAAHPDPTDAIIAAWIGLEQTAADSGVGRGASETPAEFTLRILLRRPGIDGSARALLRLYEGVRFGGHTADETMRAHAARALAEIEEGWR
ncbi:DUF4129 domain-containing protein [Microbacterium sp. H1-D42]|uniref:DUF4129 domain-containing protein n=1 Tax=Microbacterium sp. H1-D42 TaxID=2925844 RepID=UPI001F53B169|nr:DUF4129 domain-containing protein [Microbacterium sp. H1-D42]UNK72160.1 DUF4129 domain-containing protein [Microbacterium sp. H1-D42]